MLKDSQSDNHKRRERRSDPCCRVLLHGMIVDDEPPLDRGRDGSVGLHVGLEGLVVGGGAGDEVGGVVGEAEALAAAAGEEARHGHAEDVVVVEQARLLGVVLAGNLVTMDRRVFDEGRAKSVVCFRCPSYTLKVYRALYFELWA